jgi:branched-chain amino acid transport system permease protein
MDATITAFLLQDGLTTGAIYALIALALVLVFAVTRVIFVGQGDFVVFAALTLTTLQAGRLPPTLWLLLGCAIAGCVLDCSIAIHHRHLWRLPRILLNYLLPSALVCGALSVFDLKHLPGPIQAFLTLLVVTPLGPLLYRLVYQRLAETSVLMLLIVSVALHIVLLGLSLLLFGAEGSRSEALSDSVLTFGEMQVSLQSLLVIGCALGLIVMLYLLFGRTLYGKALRATAFNRNGAQLVGIPTRLAGQIAFSLAALIGACSGILIGPLTTLYYDSGFLISLKGFVAAIIGGLVSYPMAAAGAFLVGTLESFSMFWASAYKEVIVFTLVIPVLLMLSLKHAHSGEEHR